MTRDEILAQLRLDRAEVYYELATLGPLRGPTVAKARALQAEATAILTMIRYLESPKWKKSKR